MAIGATRARLIRQLLVESLLLSSLGGALGIVFAFWGSRMLVHYLSAGGPLIRLDLTPDLRVLAFTGAISAATGILFGLAPALRAATIELTPALKQGGRGSGRQQRFGKTLAAAQVTLSLALVVGAGLLVRSLQKLDDVDGGFPRDRVFTVGLSPRGSDQKNGPNGLRLNRLYLDLQQRIAAIPGVIAASFAGMRPTMQLQPRTFTTAEGAQFRGSWTMVYPKLFATLGAPILRGRDFGPQDMAEGAPPVVVINETLARRVFPNQDAIGKRILCARSGACEVIGVVRDIAYSTLKRAPESTLYQTFLQGQTGRGQMELHVRFAGDASAVAAQVRREVAAIDPNLPAFVIRTLATEVDAALIRERLLAMLTTVFGALAVLLVGIGLYGVIAYSVGRRTQEIGVRMALGASRGEVSWLVLRETLWVAGAGIAGGIPVTLGVTRLIGGFLYGVKASDPTVLVGSALFLAGIGIIAGYAPARRAARIDPMTALRQE
jgi:putative ABC transport system permease protein